MKQYTKNKLYHYVKHILKEGKLFLMVLTDLVKKRRFFRLSQKYENI